MALVLGGRNGKSEQSKGPPPLVGYSKQLTVGGWGRQKRKACTGGPFLRFSAPYFGSGSDAKFAWTNIQLLSFLTNTRVDFALAGSVFPSLPMVRPI